MNAKREETFSLDPCDIAELGWEDVCDKHNDVLHQRCGTAIGVEYLFEMDKVCNEEAEEGKELFDLIKVENAKQVEKEA